MSKLDQLVGAILRLQDAAADLGLQPVDIQLTGPDDHMTLRAETDALRHFHAGKVMYGGPPKDQLAGATIWPASTLRNRAGT